MSKSNKTMKNLGLASAAAMAMNTAQAAENPFAVKSAQAPSMQLAMMEGKCGEGKCGNMGQGKKKGMEGKCGEGKCGNMN